MVSASSIDSDLCIEALLGDADLFVTPLVRVWFRVSLRVVVEEEEEEFACEGAGGCCDDRALDDLRGDIAHAKVDEQEVCASSFEDHFSQPNRAIYRSIEMVDGKQLLWTVKQQQFRRKINFVQDCETDEGRNRDFDCDRPLKKVEITFRRLSSVCKMIADVVRI